MICRVGSLLVLSRGSGLGWSFPGKGPRAAGPRGASASRNTAGFPPLFTFATAARDRHQRPREAAAESEGGQASSRARGDEAWTGAEGPEGTRGCKPPQDGLHRRAPSKSLPRPKSRKKADGSP